MPQVLPRHVVSGELAVVGDLAVACRRGSRVHPRCGTRRWPAPSCWRSCAARPLAAQHEQEGANDQPVYACDPADFAGINDPQAQRTSSTPHAW